jgi:hypothetical protein
MAQLNDKQMAELGTHIHAMIRNLIFLEEFCDDYQLEDAGEELNSLSLNFLAIQELIEGAAEGEK